MITGTTEQLLAYILQAVTPCDTICDNVSPYGTTNSDIQSGLVISGYENVPTYSYTVSGTTPCTVQYIDRYGVTTTLAQGTGSTTTICVKYTISNNCSTYVKGSPCF